MVLSGPSAGGVVLWIDGDAEVKDLGRVSNRWGGVFVLLGGARWAASLGRGWEGADVQGSRVKRDTDLRIRVLRFRAPLVRGIMGGLR